MAKGWGAGDTRCSATVSRRGASETSKVEALNAEPCPGCRGRLDTGAACTPTTRSIRSVTALVHNTVGQLSFNPVARSLLTCRRMITATGTALACAGNRDKPSSGSQRALHDTAGLRGCQLSHRSVRNRTVRKRPTSGRSGSVSAAGLQRAPISVIRRPVPRCQKRTLHRCRFNGSVVGRSAKAPENYRSSRHAPREHRAPRLAVAHDCSRTQKATMMPPSQ